MLPASSISAISLQAPAEVNTKHLYTLDVADDFPLGIMSLTVDHKIELKCQKLLKIPLLYANTTQFTFQERMS